MLPVQSPEEVEVLVAGAGPVGLLCALALASRGVGVRVVDPHHRAALHSYALALHPQTLRLLDGWGLATPLVEHGQVVRRLAVHHRSECVATLELSAVGRDFPYVLVVPQVVLEGLLERRLSEHGTVVERGKQLLAFDAVADGVRCLIGQVDQRAGVAEPDVVTTRVRTSFLVAADGYESLARRLLGIGFVHVGRSRVYRLVEFEAALEFPEQMHLLFGETTTDVLWPLGPERGRFGLELEAGAPEVEDLAATKLAIRARAPWFTGDFGSIEWHTALRIEPRLVERFGRGRVWLVGDAAHFTTPVGVQSMNVGLCEAVDLARRIADVLRGASGEQLLLYYNEDRAREWKMLLGLQDRLRTTPHTPSWARELGARLVAALPATGRDLNALLAQVGLRLYWLRRRGAGAPDPTAGHSQRARDEI